MMLYLSYLKSLPAGSPKYISASMIANALHLGDVQVRKDIAKIARPGQCKIGREKEELISDIERCIRLDQPVKAVLIGADDMIPWFVKQCDGRVSLAAHFAADQATQRDQALPLSELMQFCRKQQIQLGILNVSSDMLHPVVDLLTESGVRAIWNFGTVPLENRAGLMIQNENLISSLGVLSYYMVHPVSFREEA
ncbi:MAG: winged-helix domain-containing protein [Faecousia sp.]